MKKSLLVILIVFYSFNCLAQEGGGDIVGINYSQSKLKYNDTSASTKQLDIKFRIPIYHHIKNTVTGSVGYKNLNLNNFPESYTQKLYGITAQAAWYYKISDKKNLTIFAQAGLFSDMKDISSKDFRYTAGVRYRIKHSDKLASGWGLAYSRQFFGNQIIPFIDVDYEPNDKWSITGQFPIKPKILYHLNKKLSAGFEVSGDASSYRLSETENNNRFIQINQWAGLIKLEYQFAKAWQFNLGIGKNFKQAYKLYNDASTTPWTIITIPLGNKPDPVREIDSKGMNVQIGISFNPFAK